MAGAVDNDMREGDNPFEVEPAGDLLCSVPRHQTRWSETMYFHVWSPEEGVGVFVHTGRWPGDLDLWWAQTIAMLPDGELLVDRSWGRAADDRGPATGNLRVTCVEPLRLWCLNFDGTGAVAGLGSMAIGPVGAGPVRSLSFDVELSAAAPVWDMGAALGGYTPQINNLSWAAFHHAQGFYATGQLRSADRRWRISGVGSRDHSRGVRDVTDLGGLQFFFLVFPKSGRVANGLVNWKPDGTVDHRVFSVQENGRCETGYDVRVTGLQSYLTHQPHRLIVTMARQSGAYRLEAEWLHGYSLTLLSPNENINGVDLSSQPDALVITQSTVRAVAPDGEIGYGVIERDYRPAMLPSPQER
ncbi:hypothetical protein [Mycobacteroides franklinii]|uniref:Hydroxyneurosporene synthase (CrtC) n=1 Tax=Mycobacteroides franklinii TaxID=948102 RepID=A0A4R5PCE5_9MYCO|nr:hypothetical protein [Mycobacteroides franklinii]TDH22427.1 hypothetical protein EJ571_10945 [Mycobacteroides franklinii]TDZ44058.1 hypothetical protein CCUG64054_04123 [Mycobacteroides franklinii]TDZ51192.1 hypothetical protein CCUG63697_02708 [Mycobacteroides franklinii]TDZ57612.1 hypothetical protein CCUG63696_04119 [Mycobacteroides franklinii]TDZ64554.1 hypothetical protein CCUG63695_04050 [Mycobacteroides franklinii]